MNLFRRHKHTWEVKAVQHFEVSIRGFFDIAWTRCADETRIRYLCSTCQKDAYRDVTGTFSLNQAKELFPKP